MCVPTVETHRYREDLLRLLQGALPSRQYEVLVLLYGLENGVEHTYAEVAVMLQCSVATVKVRRADALRLLQPRLDIRDLLRATLPTARTLAAVHPTSHD